MAEVQWIRLVVGMFDGNSFKKIKRAKIGGVSYRDKLTAVWFELLDLAGKSNANGYLIDNNEIPYRSFEDIATMLDREENEIELCMQFFVKERMVEIVDDVYCLTNFLKYQNQDGLEKIREQNRLRQAKYKQRKGLLKGNVTGNVADNVTITLGNATELDIDKEIEKDNSIVESKRKRFTPPTLEEVQAYCDERNNGVDAQRFIDYYTSNGWQVGKNKMKDWKAAVRTWERNGVSDKQSPKKNDTDDFMAELKAMYQN